MLLIAAVTIAIGPWVQAFLAVSANPKSGRTEDGPFTAATYTSVITFPIAFLLAFVALSVLRPKSE